LGIGRLALNKLLIKKNLKREKKNSRLRKNREEEKIEREREQQMVCKIYEFYLLSFYSTICFSS
jgi:hypothetical protein